MSKILNINCMFFTEFGKCTNKNYSKYFFNKQCMLIDPVATCMCEHQKKHPKPPPPPPPPPKKKLTEGNMRGTKKENNNLNPMAPPPPPIPPKRQIAEDVTLKELGQFFWTKEEKVYGSECFIVATRPFMEKSIGVFYDIKEAIELRDNKNLSMKINAFKVYPAIISIEKIPLGE